MKKVYKDILKELNKGRMVFIEATCDMYSVRWRLVEGKTCRWDTENISCGFNPSCFTSYDTEYNKVTIINSEHLIEEMYKYDTDNNIKIKRFFVYK